MSINKTSIYISERSPAGVSEAYYKQFQEDFGMFLKSRSQEVMDGGKMVLIMLGRDGASHVDRGVSFLWEILYQSLATLVQQVHRSHAYMYVYVYVMYVCMFN